MIHQVNIFLLLFGALQGWLLSLWFFRNKRKDTSNIFIALLLFIAGLQLTSKVISKMWLMDHASLFYTLSYKLPYFIGPVLYLYLKSKKQNSFHGNDLLHFLPAIALASLGWVGWNFFRTDLFSSSYTNAVLQFLLLGTYTLLSLRIAESKTRQFIVVLASAELIIIVTLALMHRYYGRFPDVRLLFVVLTFVIYWITWKVISRSGQFSDPESSVVSMNLHKTQKYAHSSLKAEEADRIERMLHKLMLEEKVYLDSSLTIDTLSQKLSTTRHNLSQVLNDRLKRTYADYMNEFRLEESRKRLSDASNFRFTIAAVAQDSGFSSVSSFNDLFKKRYNLTPSKFRDQCLNKMSA
jgi:AraC-like DNA-binding protein